MLRPRALASALKKMNTGGMQAVMLFNPEGVLLAYTSLTGDGERSKAAITANIWAIYQRQLESTESDNVQEIMFELTEAKLIITRLASVLLCLQASKDVGLGILRAKMNALIRNLEEPLSLIATS